MQKISNNFDNYLGNDRTESDSYQEVQTFIGITENNLTEVHLGQGKLLELILSPSNMNMAYKRVKSNKGSSGIDKLSTENLLEWLLEHKESLITSLEKGKYKPQAVRRVEIPKEGGKTRSLGIPTVVDRLVQQSIAQILTPIYEQEFHASSHGFRPKRGCHTALKEVESHLNDKYHYVVDLDLEKFFDTVNHSRLIELILRKVKDSRVISLIHKYLIAGVVVENKFQESVLGVPQGGPLSPLLSNIMLHELDKELARRGHRFVRYADDCLIFCKSKKACLRVKESITKFIENVLYLRVNKEKTTVGYIKGKKFLGYSFYNKSKGKWGLCVHPKSYSKLKNRLKEITNRSNGMGYQKKKELLRYYIQGWVSYFKLADMSGKVKSIDKWLRFRIRMFIWKSWKKISTKYNNLRKVGIRDNQAYQWANTRKSYCRTALSPILQTALTTRILRKSGYTFLADIYLKCIVN
ncbi:group II intron reverse transcriptase/maturase [Flavobacterium gawalongense]|uniref:RNA-directed DNA polymerase n=2 Tax=Flavobacterium gawalongense TaxID=2594432 RepID=A0A553BI83_9FLAO|nr:group II intron reverse transcriptase/maturase [Flavobacterium gawalongense]TRX00220.1 group II intron reverse transcriptase/maturase [Flavobacterium gawalongense]TRX04938.1 group II intron reverse transcriptase/maturase [Flavobacterium gawalongense]TRX07970.1 group II intron reverse transcriptase/maturase [Flavobacterium gawalongense]TRX08677.1 group II intron reverse transcriptase/maturase [Flavobacterium gawalongense]TRX24549.1 group II intron reverse transcriptase/maturase [Flavobacteri